MAIEPGVALLDLHARLVCDQQALVWMAEYNHTEPDEVTRILGKAEGVALARGKLEEILRQFGIYELITPDIKTRIASMNRKPQINNTQGDPK